MRVIDILYRTSDTRINDPLNLPDNRVDEMIKGEVMVQRVVIAGLAVCALIFSACTHSVGGGFEARYRQGLEDYQAGRRTEAIKEYRKALQVNPSSAEAHNDLGVALYDVGERAAAIEEYRRALQLKLDYAEAHNNLGVALLDAGQLVFAVSEYRQAVQLKPEFAQAQYNLCLGLEVLGQLRDALTHCRAAAQLQPGLAGVEAAVQRLQSKLAAP